MDRHYLVFVYKVQLLRYCSKSKSSSRTNGTAVWIFYTSCLCRQAGLNLSIGLLWRTF